MRNNKLIFSLAISVIAATVMMIYMAGCGQQKAGNEKLKAAFLQATLDAYTKGEVNALDKFLTADFVQYCRPPEPDIKGLDAYKQSIVEFRRGYQNVQVNIESSIMEGNFSAWRGTWQATEMSTGKQVKVEVGEMYRWANGKAVECWNYSDITSLFQQLGYKISPPVTEKTFAMVTLAQLKPGKVKDLVKLEKELSVPLMKSYKEFRGFYFLSDEKTGKVCGISIWDSAWTVGMTDEKVQAFFKEFAEKTKDFFKVKPVMEGYTVMVQE